MSAPVAPNVIREFAKKLLEEKQLTNVDAEVFEQIENDLIERIEDRINMTILAHMPEENLVEFEKLLDLNSTEEIQFFCEKHIPHIQEILSADLLAFRKTYLSL